MLKIKQSGQVKKLLVTDVKDIFHVPLMEPEDILVTIMEKMEDINHISNATDLPNINLMET